MTLDISIFVIFLGANLVVGLWKSREIKTIQDFALGGRSFTTAALVASIVAMWASGSGFLITLSKTYAEGLYYVIPSACMCVSIFLTAFIIIPRMGEFMGNTSVAEAMGNVYGKEVRIVTAIFGIIGITGGIAVQFKAFGGIFNYFFGLDSTIALYAASSIVIIYSSFGGIKAVTNTDVLQFFTFGFAVPLIGVIIWYSLSNDLTFTGVFNNHDFNDKFNLFEILKIDNIKFWETIPLLLWFALPGIDAMDFQRISMAKDLYQAQKAWVVAGILLFFFEIASAWIPTLLRIWDPNLDSEHLINYIADNFTFMGLKGVIMVGIASLAMSTADSRLNASAVLFANDLVQSEKVSKLFISRIFSVILGIAAIFIAISSDNLLNIVIMSTSFYMPVVSVPLLMMIMGFRSSKISVLIGMGAGITMVLYCNILNPSAYSIIKAMITNLVFLLASHFILTNMGFSRAVTKKKKVRRIEI